MYDDDDDDDNNYLSLKLFPESKKSNFRFRRRKNVLKVSLSALVYDRLRRRDVERKKEIYLNNTK